MFEISNFQTIWKFWKNFHSPPSSAKGISHTSKIEKNIRNSHCNECYVFKFLLWFYVQITQTAKCISFMPVPLLKRFPAVLNTNYYVQLKKYMILCVNVVGPFILVHIFKWNQAEKIYQV